MAREHGCDGPEENDLHENGHSLANRKKREQSALPASNVDREVRPIRYHVLKKGEQKNS